MDPAATQPDSWQRLRLATASDSQAEARVKRLRFCYWGLAQRLGREMAKRYELEPTVDHGMARGLTRKR